jgi:hypothetical protein
MANGRFFENLGNLINAGATVSMDDGIGFVQYEGRSISINLLDRIIIVDVRYNGIKKGFTQTLDCSGKDIDVTHQKQFMDICNTCVALTS